MNCQRCGGKSRVMDSRQPIAAMVIRRRVCRECGYRWNTAETETGEIRPDRRTQGSP